MSVDLEQYRSGETEQARLENLLSILPKPRRSVLDVGARDGYISRLLTPYFHAVTALDLTMPAFQINGVAKVQGDVTRLGFSDNSFDVVVCAEVLEHIPEPQLGRACGEIARVAKREVVIGVPYRQDIRFGRTTCSSCGRKNPPWAHVNSFHEDRLKVLFKPLRLARLSLIGPNSPVTNAVSCLLMDLAGNPWGTYNQEEPCIYCGAALVRLQQRSLFQRVCSKTGALLTLVQNSLRSFSPMWIHAVFVKREK